MSPRSWLFLLMPYFHPREYYYSSTPSFRIMDQELLYICYKGIAHYRVVWRRNNKFKRRFSRGYTILLYVAFCITVSRIFETTWLPSFSVIFTPTMTWTGILPLFLTTPTTFRFPFSTLRGCCSGIITVSSVTLEDTLYILDWDNSRKEHVRRMTNNERFNTPIFDEWFSIISTMTRPLYEVLIILYYILGFWESKWHDCICEECNVSRYVVFVLYWVEYNNDFYPLKMPFHPNRD